MKLQTALEAEKTQPSDALEKEKWNMTHTECSFNLQAIMKGRQESKMGIDKLDHKDGAGAHKCISYADKHEQESCAAKDYHEEEPLTNNNLKDDLGTSVSDEHQP